MTKAVLPSMLKQNYGRILLISSIAGKEGNAGMVESYSASKAGVIGLVKERCQGIREERRDHRRPGARPPSSPGPVAARRAQVGGSTSS